MKKKALKSVIIASASVATLAAQALAQVGTNVVNQEDVEAVISGTFSAPAATVVKGSSAETTYLRSAISVVSTIKIPYTAIDTTTTDANGNTKYTYQQKLATYAYGNAEILKLALASSNVTGWSLAYTNAWANNAYPLNNGAGVALKTNTAPVSAVTNWFVVAPGDGVELSDIAYTNGVPTKRNGSNYYPANFTLAGGGSGEGFGAFGVVSAPTITWVKNVQSFASGNVTNTYWTGGYSGSFSGAGADENNTD